MKVKFAAFRGGVVETQSIPAAQAQAANALEGILDQPIIWRWDNVVYEGGLMANTTGNVRILVKPNGFVSLRPTV